MTQVLFTVNEEVTALRLNQATQGFKFLRRTVFTGSTGSPVSSGPTAVACATWLVGSGTAGLFVMVNGPGGGGGSAEGGTPANTSGVGAGGGGGGYSENWILSGFGSSQVVKLGLGGNCASGLINGGPGGTTEFGTLISAGSGLGGTRLANTTGTAFVAGAQGGIGSLGINTSGGAGGTGMVISSNVPVSGRGGQSAFGGGGAERTTTTSGDGGERSGGGGSGAAVQNAATATNRAGGPGSFGFVVVDEYA